MVVHEGGEALVPLACIELGGLSKEDRLGAAPEGQRQPTRITLDGAEQCATNLQIGRDCIILPEPTLE